MWTLRRNEKDVVNLYDYLSTLMQISTGGNFLNFGYWNKKTEEPLEAQKGLCHIVGDLAELSDAKQILDVGSGFSEPSLVWADAHPQINIVCMNTNPNQIKFGMQLLKKTHSINVTNSTATMMPFTNESIDRIIALESAQHFKPFNQFTSEAKRVLRKKGILILAIPLLSKPLKFDIFKIGVLKFTWSSEHYDFETVKAAILSEGLRITKNQFIGSNVYPPLAEYYIKNREFLKSKIDEEYPPYVEKILFKSILKMKEASEKGIIEYALIKCVKP